MDGFVSGFCVFLVGLCVFIRGGDRGRVVDGFDFFLYATFGDQGFEGLDGFEDAVGDAVEFTEDGEVGAIGGVVFAVEHVVVADVFHLEKAKLEVDELLEEHVVGGCDGLVLFEEVVDGYRYPVGMGDEVPVVFHGVEAVLEGIGGRAGFAGIGARAGGFLVIATVSGKSGLCHPFLAGLGGRTLLCGWQRIPSVVLSVVWSVVFHG